MAKKHFVYKITNTINGKIYIGKTSNVDRRWAQHLKAAINKDSHLYNSMRKYGIENFSISIIEEVSKSRIDEIEQYWITKLNTTNTDIGYNVHMGGTGGDTYSNKTELEKEVERKKRSDSMRRLFSTNLEYYEKKKKQLQLTAGTNNFNWNGYYYAQSTDGKILKFKTKRSMMLEINVSSAAIYSSINKNRPLKRGKYKGWKFFKSKKNLI